MSIINLFAFCRCTIDDCSTDDDCHTGGPCACRLTSSEHAGTNVCLAGNCRVDADCGSKGYCSPTFDYFCGASTGVTATFCHTPYDNCIDDADCGAGSDCRYNPFVVTWVCASGRCAN